MTSDLARSLPQADLETLLDAVRRRAAAAMVVQVEGTPDAYVATLRGLGSARVRLQVEDAPPHRIRALSLDTTVVAEQAAAAAHARARSTWPRSPTRAASPTASPRTTRPARGSRCTWIWGSLPMRAP